MLKRLHSGGQAATWRSRWRTPAAACRATSSRAFEPFFTTKTVGKGSGLGLSQVYGFAKQSGGHATIDSVLGGGTTVMLYLPTVQIAPARCGDGATVLEDRALGETILLVEDDADVRRSVGDLLQTLGYEVLQAADGHEALDCLRRGGRVDLVLTDVVMPGMSGVELALEARRLRHGLKILLTSGYAREMLARHGDRGEFALIAKPYQQQELAKEVRRALEA